MLNQVQGQPEGVKYLSKVISGQLRCSLLLDGPSGVGRRYSVAQAALEGFPRKERDRQVQQELLAAGQHPDWHILTASEGAIGVDPIRELIDKVAPLPSRAKWRFAVIDGCDNMTIPAANALLKTLEEPPSHVRFFLLCNQASKVLPTIRSRCGHVKYHRLSEEWLVQKVREVEPDELRARVCCRYAQGSMGEAMRFWASGRLGLRSKAIQALKGSLTGDWSALCQAIDAAEKDLPVLVTLLEHILADLQIMQALPDRVTNLDLTSDLRGIGAPPQMIQKWLDGLHSLPSADVNTFSLHLKSYLISAGANG